MKICKMCDARIYVGSREGYDGLEFTEMRVLDAIRVYQETAPENRRGTVRVTPTRYIFQKYDEAGWEIGLINYARFPLKWQDFMEFGIALAKHLLVSLKQNRVTLALETGDNCAAGSMLFEAENPEDHPRCRMEKGGPLE